MAGIVDIASDQELGLMCNLIGFRPYDVFAQKLDIFIQQEMDKIMENPVMDQENMRRDFRYKLGVCQGMKNALKEVKNVREYTQ